MISQEYLTLLNSLQSVDSPDIDRAWKSFVYDWHNDGDLEYTLTQLARHCFTFVALKCGSVHITVQNYQNTTSLKHSYNTTMYRAGQMHRRKNQGYSGDSPDPWANFRNCEQFGISAVQGCITRMCDKYARYTNLKNNKSAAYDEAIEDTVFDLASYSIILICLLREETKFDGVSDYEYAHAI